LLWFVRPWISLAPSQPAFTRPAISSLITMAGSAVFPPCSAFQTDSTLAKASRAGCYLPIVNTFAREPLLQLFLGDCFLPS
jgi:hypothetical protein